MKKFEVTIRYIPEGLDKTIEDPEKFVKENDKKFVDFFTYKEQYTYSINWIEDSGAPGFIIQATVPICDDPNGERIFKTRKEVIAKIKEEISGIRERVALREAA